MHRSYIKYKTTTAGRFCMVPIYCQQIFCRNFTTVKPKTNMKSTCPLYILLLLEVGNFFQADGALKDRSDFEQAIWSTRKMPNIPHSSLLSGKTLRQTELDFINLLIDVLKDFNSRYGDGTGFGIGLGPGNAEDKTAKEVLVEEGRLRSLPSRDSFTPTETEKHTSDLENLADGLSGYRSKGGFTFRFGRK